MRNLNKATTNPETFLKEIINSKKKENKKRLERLKSDLIERFEIYTNKANNRTLHTLVEKWHYDKDCKICDGYFLYHQYDNSDACISKLRGEIIENNNGEITLTCPICGLRDATDLDHYIPRQLFPEFSIHPYNLIPICHKCNNKKTRIGANQINVLFSTLIMTRLQTYHYLMWMLSLRKSCQELFCK